MTKRKPLEFHAEMGSLLTACDAHFNAGKGSDKWIQLRSSVGRDGKRPAVKNYPRMQEQKSTRMRMGTRRCASSAAAYGRLNRVNDRQRQKAKRWSSSSFHSLPYLRYGTVGVGWRSKQKRAEIIKRSRRELIGGV